MKRKTEKDPFHSAEPQVSNVYEYEEPPDLRPFDERQGGLNVPPVEITDPEHRAAFKPEPEHVKEYDFSKRRK